ncbi:MAG: Dabb family protein [Candidatus Hydrogenedentes bacterium]|nr:Dabb family protein [Candidatus Hydrogenedentota bacterium]
MSISRWTMLLAAPALLAGCVSIKGNVVAPEMAKDESGVYRHVVLFKYKEGTTPEQVLAIEKAFLDLKNGIDVIKTIEAGPNSSTENLNKGFTNCFIVTFADPAGRDAYLPHPEHKKFVEFVGPYLEEALVVDFVPRR